jgi:hypothetical protein
MFKKIIINVPNYKHIPVKKQMIYLTYKKLI